MVGVPDKAEHGPRSEGAEAVAEGKDGEHRGAYGGEEGDVGREAAMRVEPAHDLVAVDDRGLRDDAHERGDAGHPDELEAGPDDQGAKQERRLAALPA